MSRQGLMDDSGYYGFEECSDYEICCEKAYKQGRADALSIDMDKPMHFTDEQKAWIKNYIIINAKRQRAEAIDDSIEIVGELESCCIDHEENEAGEWLSFTFDYEKWADMLRKWEQLKEQKNN